MSTRSALGVVLAVALAARAAHAQDPAVEAWARDLVDAPGTASGDLDARAVLWLERIERDPAHPLVEALLYALADTDPLDPEPIARRTLALDGSKMLPSAAAALERIQSAYRIARTARGALGTLEHADHFRGTLYRCAVLGPLPRELDLAARARLFADPGFGRAHEGLYGREVRWMDATRPATAPYFELEQLVAPRSGWALAAIAFDAPGGGPGWIEVDVSASNRADAVEGAIAEGEAVWWSAASDPSFTFALNAAAPIEVDLLSRERSRVHREPVVLRGGVNRLLVAMELGDGGRFAVRVLDRAGRPWPDLSQAAAFDAPIAAAIAAAPPTEPIATSESFLASLAQRGPDSQAMLGWLAMRDGRPSEGLAHLRRALEMAPDRLALAALAAQAYLRAGHLPESYRRARSRELAERVAATDPGHARVQRLVARTLAEEDREEEAIARLLDVSSRHPANADAELDLAWVYSRLEFAVPSERAIAAALERAPRAPRVLDHAVANLESAGRATQALALRRRALASGQTPERLRDLGSAQEDVGELEESIASYRASADLAGTAEAQRQLAQRLVRANRLDEADQVYAQLAARLPRMSADLVQRADLARRRGDAAAEREHLRAALARDPSGPEIRERLRALGEVDPAREFLARERVDVAAEVARFDAEKWNDSVVRVVDAAAVWFFEDGSFEQLTQARLLVRDLQGCESQGKQRTDGDVLRIATIKKADGSEHEPVLVDGEYVMPALEPGDSVEVETRSFQGARSDGVVRGGVWRFASTDEPFHVSRYAVSLPKSLGLTMVLKSFDGEHEVRDEGEREVHVLVARDRERVVLDPGAPPPPWLLPWVEFGRGAQRADVAEQLARVIEPSVRVTPEIREAAERALAGIEGDEARARTLHALVGASLDNRTGDLGSATAALVRREGNPNVLYAALLDAAGIERDLVWSRGVDPAGDGEPDPPFTDPSRWWRELLVLVRPGDGPPAWCDMSAKTLPYGVIVGDAPRAEAFATRAREWTELPDVPLAERPGEEHELAVALDSGRGAEVDLTIRPTGNTGFAIEEALKELPASQLKRAVTRFASQVVAGVDVASYDFPGLDDPARPVEYHVVGNVKSFLDEAGGELACKLPFPPLQLGRLASGEGERRHPFFLPASVVRRSTARFTLPEGTRLAEPPPEVHETFMGARFDFTCEREGEGAFTIRRELVMPPLLVELERYPALVEFAKRVDEADRARLRFAR